MKNLFKIIFLFIVVSPIIVFADSSDNKLKAIRKDDMIKLSMTKIYESALPSDSTAAQGIDSSDKYIVITHSNKTNKDNDVEFLDLSLKNKVIKKISIGHGNDVTYNSNSKEFMFIDNNNLVIVNEDNLDEINTRILKTSAFALTFNPIINEYYFAKGDTGFIANSNFETIKSFDIAVNVTRQSFKYYDGILYYSNYEPGRATIYQKLYDGVLEAGANVVYTFDSNGNFIKAFYIPSGYGELEGITFVDNKPIALFNSDGKEVICRINEDIASFTRGELRIISDNNVVVNVKVYYDSELKYIAGEVSSSKSLKLAQGTYYLKVESNEKYNVDDSVKTVAIKAGDLANFSINVKEKNNETIENIPDTEQDKSRIILSMGIVMIFIGVYIINHELFLKRIK